MSFEIARNYGSTMFLVYKVIEQLQNATLVDVQNETELSEKQVRHCLINLTEIKLLNRVQVRENDTYKYRYSTVH